MLEKLLEAIVGLTNALNAHAAALSANPTKAAKGKAATETPPAGAAAANTVTGTGPAATPQSVQSAAPASQPSAAATVSAQDAGNAMVSVANEISREAAVAILANFGAATFAGVKPDSYAAFKAACDTALAAHRAKAAAPATGAAGLM
jgi:hypothetical protein